MFDISLASTGEKAVQWSALMKTRDQIFILRVARAKHLDLLKPFPYITISDEVKEDSELAINQLKNNGIKTVMLSGDKDSLTQNIAKKLGIDSAFGGLLPEGKVEKLENLKSNPKEVVAFVGDGINDAPVLALSDVGMAMGGLGSDAAIETADVVIMTDKPSKVAEAIKVGRKTHQIVWQNIIFALVIKGMFIALGIFGVATMWSAVFADVGVALLAIFNSTRVLRSS